MQGLWKKAGAALGSAIMIGSTLVGAALAQEDAMDLGDYQDLITDNGNLNSVYVVGADAATADVVTAMGMTAYAGNMQVAGEGGAEGEVTLTPISTQVEGVKRHIEIDNASNYAYEFSSKTAQDVIGPEEYASDGVVDFLYSHNEKGPIYVNGTEYAWREKVLLSLDKIAAERDTVEAQAGDQYDEILMPVTSQSMKYEWYVETDNISSTNAKGKKIWFMGKEYTVISVSSGTIKLGATDSEVVLTTSNPTTTVEGVDVTLGGIYSAGTSGAYKAKVTVTNGGTTETKYITSENTDTIAGIEVYVKNAVVTTIGTNEGEAQLVVGAGVLKLKNSDYLERGDGEETRWYVRAPESDDDVLRNLTVTYMQDHTAGTGDYPVLKEGDSISAPNDLFSLGYTGPTDQYGSETSYRDVYFQPESRDLKRGDANEKTIRVKTSGGNFIKFGGLAKDEIWVAVNETDSTDAFYYKDTSGLSTTYHNITESPTIELTTSDSLKLYFDGTAGMGATTNDSALLIEEPALSESSAQTNMTIEYNGTSNKFEDIGEADGYYIYYEDYVNATPTSASANWIARSSNYTTSVRDYYTQYGTYVETAGNYQVALKAPKGQSYAEFIFGTSETGEGDTVTAAMGEQVDIDGTTVTVEGSVSGETGVTLPSTVAALDSDVTSSHKASYTLVLVGGPAVNTLVNELQTGGKLEKTIGAPGSEADVAAAGAGVVELVDDAWGTGKYAIVVAGSDRAGTSAAGNILANFDDHADTLDGETFYTV